MLTPEQALEIAKKAHEGQTEVYQADDGQMQVRDYIHHVLRVYESVKNNYPDMSEEDTACAILHDVFEDSDFNQCYLENEGATPRQIEIVLYLTRFNDETYTEYINSIFDANPYILRSIVNIKVEDLLDNIKRCEHFRPSLKKRYKKALEIIAEGIQKNHDRFFQNI